MPAQLIPTEPPPGLTLERRAMRIGHRRLTYYTVGRICDKRDQPCVRGLWSIMGSGKTKRAALERAWQRYEQGRR